MQATNQPLQEQESRSLGAFGPDPSLEEVAAGQTNPNCQLQNQTECVQVMQ